tara:strand:- start:8202 stop:10361 length:2160 start_codon:yes stop_codon:yes gene_type:complete
MNYQKYIERHNPMDGLFCLRNRKSKKIERREPWSFDKTALKQFRSKDELRAWENSNEGDSCLYSLIEGAVPNQSLDSNDNPPKYIHGFVADYDCKMDDAEFTQFMSRVIDNDIVPNWAYRSISGGVHIVFLLEEKVHVPTSAHLNRFLTRAKKDLCLTKLGREFDDAAWRNVYSYYSPGFEDWSSVSKATIPVELAYLWLYSTSKETDYSGHGPEIPMEDISKELDSRFPGEVPHAQNGSRCRYFWGDNPGNNPNSCIVRPEGITVFTDRSPKGFYSWEEILGRDFVRKYEQKKIGGCIAPYFFNGKGEYMYSTKDGFETLNKDSLRLALECRHGLRTKPPKKGGPSEIHQALFAIESTKRVDGFIPFAYVKDRLVDFRGKTYFNTATVCPMPPDLEDEHPQWGDRFPGIADWMRTMFGDEQLRYELAWLAYAYQNALRGTPEKGQAHFLCGPKNCGKTLYNTTVLGNIFGRHMKATEYFMKEVGTFNDYLFEEGFWTIDDSSPTNDKKQLLTFTSMVKEFVANDEFHMGVKHAKSTRVFWRGRLGVTLNDDPESIRLIPDLSMSIVDKIMVFRCSDGFSFTRGFKSQVEEELPAFANFLWHYDIPSDLQDIRFGVKSYINEDISEMVRQGSELETFISIVDWAKETLADSDLPGRDGVWQGTAGELMRLAETEGAKTFTRSLSPSQLGSGLTKLFLQGWNGLERVPGRANRTEWKISI